MHGVMTGLAVVTGLLTLVAYVALRRARPVGIALDPWRYIVTLDAGARFERNLPNPGDTICDRAAPPVLLRGLEAIHPTYLGLTRCFLPPHTGKAHNGLLITRDVPPVTMMSGYTWLDDPAIDTAAARLRRRRRFGRVRRAVLRWAAG